MSNITEKTEYKVLDIIARIIKQFEQLHYLDMNQTDDSDAAQAIHLLEGIIQSNGYKVNYDRKIKKPLLKTIENV